MNERYFEDIRAGDRFRSADHAVTEGEIIANAKRHDRQPFHIDTVAVSNSIFD